jgi:hypothetical protein
MARGANKPSDAPAVRFAQFNAEICAALGLSFPLRLGPHCRVETPTFQGRDGCTPFNMRCDGGAMA